MYGSSMPYIIILALREISDSKRNYFMHLELFHLLLAELEAGTITWPQALTQVTALPSPWTTAEWKQRRDELLGTTCTVCTTTDGPFVLQHLTHCASFKEVCYEVKAEFRERLWETVIPQVTDELVAEHIGEGEKRNTCPTCGSISLRERKTMYPPFLCQKCEKDRHPAPFFETPVVARYYIRQKTTDRKQALAMAREFLTSVAMVAELRRHDDAIQHEATLRSLRQSITYRSLQHTATYCKKCAFKEDLPIIDRKKYGMAMDD